MAGTVEEVGPDFRAERAVAPGDKIYSLLTLRAVPLYLESIDEIDFVHGQIRCRGYAILFESSPFCLTEDWEGIEYTMTALDEAGNLSSAANLACGLKTITVLGRDALSLYLYAAAARKTNPTAHIAAVADLAFQGAMENPRTERYLREVIDEIFVVDLAEPIQSVGRLEGIHQPADLAIIAEDIMGTETLAAAITKSHGTIYFTTVVNQYGLCQAVAESIGKPLIVYGFSQYVEKYETFTMDLIRSRRRALRALGTTNNRRGKNRQSGESPAENSSGTGEVAFQSSAMTQVLQEALGVAKYDCNLVIEGEAGAGKEMILSMIHQNSQRKGGPCIRVNCATLKEESAEGDFLGYRPGALAEIGNQGREGYLEQANGGILYLDEVGFLPMNLQTKLLQVLQDNTFYKVGGGQPLMVNVRIIAGSKTPLQDLVRQDLFRADLFYRLNICMIHVPPLRERQEDVPVLAEAFLRQWNEKYGIERHIARDGMQTLRKYHWPGNVQELENVIHRLVVECQGNKITREQVEDLLHKSVDQPPAVALQTDFGRAESLDFHDILERQERLLVQYALAKGGTTRRAAELLGLPQTTLARKKNKFGL